jgi:hypothetical protein
MALEATNDAVRGAFPDDPSATKKHPTIIRACLLLPKPDARKPQAVLHQRPWRGTESFYGCGKSVSTEQSSSSPLCHVQLCNSPGDLHFRGIYSA